MSDIIRSEPGDIVVLNEWGPIPSYYIRLKDPLEAIGVNFITISGLEEDAEHIIKKCKTLVVQRGYGNRVTSLAQIAKKFGCRIIYETDDNLLDLPKDSNFKLKEEHKSNIIRLIRMSDEITVSTSSLKSFLSSIADINVHILLNYGVSKARVRQTVNPHLGLVNTDYFKLGETKQQFFEAISAAITSHNYDVSFYGSIDPGMIELKNRYVGRVNIIDRFEPNRSNFLDNILKSGVNVAAVPLSQSPEHIYKSDIKFLDFASIGVPGIYNNSEVYPSVTSGLNGYMCSDTKSGWLDGLIFFADHNNRQVCGQISRQEVLEERSIANYCSHMSRLLYKNSQ